MRLTFLEVQALIEVLEASDAPGKRGDETFTHAERDRFYDRLMKLRTMGMVEREPTGKMEWRATYRARQWLYFGRHP